MNPLRYFCLLSLLLSGQLLYAQSAKKPKLRKITITGTFESFLTKSGYKINDYYVENLTEEEYKKYEGKQVKLKGKYYVVKAIKENEEPLRQGAIVDRKFVRKRRIWVL